MESHAKRKGWWSRPAKALLSLTLVASGFSAAGAPSKAEAASGTPGGGIQAPVLWLKADDGASAANGGLTGWQDRSPNPVAFTLDLPNGAKVPQYNESGVNFNPSVKFANPANWSHYNSSAKLLGDKNITFQSGYAVYKWPEAGSAGTLVGSSDLKPSNGVIVMGGYGSDISNGPGREKVYSYASSNIRDRYQLINYEIGETAHTASIDGQNKNVRFQSTTFTPFTFMPVIGATNAPNSNNWTGLQAEVAEIILYDTITSADAAKIETYLAVKYGITLNHDYIGTDGTLLWSKTANAAYHHNVAGLGRDNLEDLNQKQSRSINKDTQVAIGLGGLAEANSGNTAALANGQYLLWGDNGEPLKFTQQRGSTDWYQAERIWKVQNNGIVGEVEIAIPASAAPGAVKLLVSDTDTDFAHATEYELSSITLANTAHYAAKVTLKDGQYFTFAAEAPELQYSLLEQIAEDGHEIVLAFDQEMTTANLAGFSVQIGGTAVPIGSLPYRVDPADSKKLILTLPEGTDVKGKTVTVAYDGTGSLKSTYGAPAKPFSVSPRDQFIDSLKITQPAGSPVNVPKPEITGEAEEGSAVAIVIRDKDGQIVTGAGGNAVVEADGTWSFTPGSDLHDGEYTIEATATKGVKSAVATKGITVNLPVPGIEITAPGGETVTDPKPEFQGTTDPGATVTAVIKDEDGQTIGTPAVTVNADGTWSFKPEAALPYGKYTVEVTSAKNGKTNLASKTITVVDKSKLQAEVDLSSTLDEEDYTPGSWTGYASKLTTAQAVLGNATATQAEVDTALAELTAAREALVLKPVVDKSKLQAEVDLSSTLEDEDYTPGSWTSYESKLTTAQAVLGSATATQAEVDTALAELTAAREALVLKPVVDKSKLQAEVDLSSTLDEEDYTTGSWTSYESKLTTAQAVLGSATATQTEVDTALAELTAAREALVLKPDKSKLQAEVDLSSTLDEEYYTPGSWTGYASKLNTAQAVLASATATQAEVDTALAELTAAREALVLKPDKSKLQAEVDLSSTLEEGDYTPGSWTDYASKLTTAQAVLGNATATQAEVDAALAELTAAREALVLKPVVDKSKLQAEVDLSSTLDEEDYTPGSWTDYASKLTTAQAVLGSATATQAEVDTALADLTAAREALDLKPVVDKSKLQAEVDLSSTLEEEDYTTGSWTDYASKLTTAQAVLGSATATQAEVDTALAELTAAREALVLKPVVDKSKLQAEVDLSSTLDEEDYTPGSWTDYVSKLTNAQAVLGSATATQAEVDTALAELTAAREALVLKPVVDKSKLQAEVDLSSTLDEEDYTPGSWTDYVSKLTNAQAVLGSATATQAEVDTALAELTAAREALVLKPVVDKSKLQAEVDLSSTLDEEDYTPGSWTDYASKLTTAQAVLTSSTATQAEVDAALAELTAAREALVLKPVVPVVDKSKLQAEVDLSSTLHEEDYTPGSWTDYASKLTTAQAVLASDTATQAEVDTSLAELTAAREALVLKPVVDKSKLQAEVDLSSTLDKEDYTPGSWTGYASKLTTAQAVLGSATATQAEVDTALAELTAAREALVLKPVVDKSKLQAEVDLSSTLEEEDYTTGSWTSYESKLTTAQAVLGSPTATQAEVDTALTELTAAREALVLKPVVPVVDKSKLQAEVDLSAILDKETYTPASWTSYESMLTDAQAVLASATATQAEVDTALEALQGAYRALVPKSGLASIAPSAGVIQPNVTASVYEYSLNVEYNVFELQLTLAAAHPDAAITVNGQAAGTGQASAAVTLNVGDNTVTIVVRETDGSEKTYTVTVRRQSAPFEPNEPSQTPYVPSNTPTPALPVIERITVDVEAIGYGIVAKTEIERTTNNDGSKSDKVTFTTAKALEAVEKTLAAHSPSVRIVIPDKQDVVKDVRVELPDAAVKAVQDAGLNLEIYTDNGMVTIPNASLSGLNPNLYFHLVPVKQESERKQVEERARTEEIVRKALNNGNVYVVDRPITIETNMTSRPVTITLPLDSSHVPAEASAREAYLSKLAVFIEHSDGERELVKPAIVTYGDNKLGLTFTIGKFSTFTILNLDNGGAESHQAYMVGMPDGTFKPENAMTRAQVAMILYRVLELQGAGTARYSDVAGSHWAAEAIRQVTAAGLMKGMTDGSFRPEQSITRAEMAVIIARWKALSGKGEHGYSDAAGHWAEKAIGQTNEAGYMEGMLDGSFQPNKALTRAEGVTVFNRVLERGPLYGETSQLWSDVPVIHWAFYQIEEASRKHSFTSRPEGGETMIKP
ncbi:S-layer homology domain-containing protein [Paenibacillus sp. FSL M7-0896]|uniref:S-layer homology domain-containing protein n=1 Tax=Paenibacillus sp. FSL M7-0896 TaxID=2921610 RepID=UPI0030D9C90C